MVAAYHSFPVIQQLFAAVSRGYAGLRQLQRRLASFGSGVWGALRQIYSAKLAVTTCVLMFTWMVAAFVYYGLVSLVSQEDFVDGGHKTCQDQKLFIPVSGPPP